jgi:serine/threonine protein kinase
MAPEMVGKQHYGAGVDMWSAGVLLYILLCGQVPFVGTREAVYDAIIQGRYSVRVTFMQIYANLFLNITNNLLLFLNR